VLRDSLVNMGGAFFCLLGGGDFLWSAIFAGAACGSFGPSLCVLGDFGRGDRCAGWGCGGLARASDSGRRWVGGG